MKRIILLCFLSSFYSILESQNLLNTSTWTLGSGSVAGFSVNGSSSENWRINGKDHLGRETIIWEARNDATRNADGGWNTSYKNIDKNKTYRLSVWIKKTNSNNGTTYFGTQRYRSDYNVYNNTLLNLSGTVNRNPYFWYGDLPKLDRWYLLVAFVHPQNYSSSTNFGKMYDGVTGEEVLTLRDFKFSHLATLLRHRAYLYYDTDVNDRQYFLYPRMEEVNGQEPTINQLMGINSDSNLILAFDNMGNQKQRFYCSDPGCNVPPPPNGIVDEDAYEEHINTNLLNQEVLVEVEDDEANEEILEFKLYPNPASDKVSIVISSKGVHLTSMISLYDINGSLITESKVIEGNSKHNLDISNFAAGVYIMHGHLSNGQSFSERFIKK